MTTSPGALAPPRGAGSPETAAPRKAETALLIAVLGALSFLAYLPALDNGFISDDFIMLDWVEQWREDFFFLFRISPDIFRIPTYVVLRAFSHAFGYHAAPLYAFVILVHVANCFLLYQFCRLRTGGSQAAFLAALLFVALQDGQEAIMWIAAMTYALAGFSILAALVLWAKERCAAAATVFLAGLFTSESLLVLLLLIPLSDYWAAGRLRWRRRYLVLLLPPLVFAAVFWATLPANYMLAEHAYAPGWHGAPVLARSIFRLTFPGVVLAAAILWLAERRLALEALARGIAWSCITLLPFVFLTYQNHVPSRHAYVPAMGSAMAIAGLLAAGRNRGLRHALAAILVLANIAYIWLRKDAQFEERARPTTLLLEELRNRTPERIVVAGFPLNPWMAKAAARHVPGWDPTMIEVGVPEDSCSDCPKLWWNPQRQKYEGNLSGRLRPPRGPR